MAINATGRIPNNPNATAPVAARSQPEDLAIRLVIAHGYRALELVEDALRKQETPDREKHMILTLEGVQILLS